MLQQKLLPLYYHDNLDVSQHILQALYAAGIRMVEYTARGEAALVNFGELKRGAAESMPDLLLGIGTIKNRRQAGNFIRAGADFIICPAVNPEVADEAHSAGLLWIPGCMTPTEIVVAEEAGASLVKIFPGNVLGPAFISSVRELFPALKFLPTGGVEAEEANLKKWFGAGAVAVGMGSKLIAAHLVQEKAYGKIKASVEAALNLVKNAAAGRSE